MADTISVSGFQIDLSDGRHVFVAEFEGRFYIRFRSAEGNETRLALSNEAADALRYLLKPIKESPQVVTRWLAHMVEVTTAESKIGEWELVKLDEAPEPHPMKSEATPGREARLLERLEAGARHIGYPEDFPESMQQLCRDASNAIRRLAAKPTELTVDEHLSIIVGVKTVLEFAIGLAWDAERLIPDSEPKRLRDMLNNIRQGYLKPAVKRLSAASPSTTGNPKP